MRRDVVKIITETEEQMVRLISTGPGEKYYKSPRLQRLSAIQKAQALRRESKAKEKASLQSEKAWSRLLPPLRLSQIETELKTKRLLISLSGVAIEDLHSDTNQSAADKQNAIETHEQRRVEAESDIIRLEQLVKDHKEALAFLAQPKKSVESQAWNMLQRDAQSALSVCSRMLGRARTCLR